MPSPFTPDDVLAAVTARHVPQCFEQIAKTIETRHELPAGAVKKRGFTLHVRPLLQAGSVVELLDPAIIAALGAFPQHYSRNTRFYLGADVARDKLDPERVRQLLDAQRQAQPPAVPPPAQPVEPGLFDLPAVESAPAPAAPAPTTAVQPDTRPDDPSSAPARPAHTATGTPRRSAADATRPAAGAPATSAATRPQRTADRAARTDRESATSGSVVFLPPLASDTARPRRTPSARAGGPRPVANIFQPHFSSGPVAAPDTTEGVVDDATDKLAALFTEAARRLRAQTDAVLLPLNRAWNAGEFGEGADYVAERLSALHDLATTYYQAMDTVGRELSGRAEDDPRRDGTAG